MKAHRLAVGALMIALAACSKDGGSSEAPGSCYREKDNACAEYGRAEAAAGKRLCSGMTWRSGEGTCPIENRLGTCALKAGGREHLYSGPPNTYSVNGAKTACESGGGMWTAIATVH